MSSWTVVREYAAQVEAEFDRETLEEAGIPAIIRGSFVGAFGPGFAGGTPFGIRVLVPGEELQRARDVLGLEADEAL